jgi:hypothetical protein
MKQQRKEERKKGRNDIGKIEVRTGEYNIVTLLSFTPSIILFQSQIFNVSKLHLLPSSGNKKRKNAN